MSDDDNESAASAQNRRSAALVSTGTGNPGGYQLTIAGLTAAGKAIAVDAFSWGVTNSASTELSGAGTGRADAKALNIQKTSDEMSALLMKAAASGQQFTSATLSVAKPAGTTTSGTIPYLVLTLEDVLVSGFQVSGSNAELPGEAVSLNFARMTYKASGLDAKSGTTGITNQASWDLAANTVK